MWLKLIQNTSKDAWLTLPVSLGFPKFLCYIFEQTQSDMKNQAYERVIIKKDDVLGGLIR